MNEYKRLYIQLLIFIEKKNTILLIKSNGIRVIDDLLEDKCL